MPDTNAIPGVVEGQRNAKLGFQLIQSFHCGNGLVVGKIRRPSWLSYHGRRVKTQTNSDGLHDDVNDKPLWGGRRPRHLVVPRIVSHAFKTGYDLVKSTYPRLIPQGDLERPQ
jgi:hypothetical protein